MNRGGWILAALALGALLGGSTSPDPSPTPQPAPGPPMPPLDVLPGTLDAMALAALEQGRIAWAPWVPIQLGPYTLEVATDAPSVGGWRLSVSHLAAQALADAAGALLPTPAIVDAIEAAAVVRPPPHTQADLARMQSTESWTKHAAKLTADAGDPPSPVLVAPVGKDYVQVPQLRQRPTQAAIYGWARIQPVSLVHEARYRDYSHIGPRLVRRLALGPAGAVDLAALYESGDPAVAPLGPTPARHPAAPPLLA
jgi:hypothetical protein